MDPVDITGNSEAELEVFRYEKFQNPDLENSPILSKANEKNKGSLKRKIDSSKEIVPKKLLRHTDTDVVIDLFLNGSSHAVRSGYSFSTGDARTLKENGRIDSTNESHSNVLPFVRKNINNVNSSNFDDKSITSENAEEEYQAEILNIAEQKERLPFNRKVFEISTKKNEINSNFQTLTTSEENMQHNNAFCEISLTDGAKTKNSSSAIFENSVMCTNDAKTLVNDPEKNYSSLVKNMVGTSIPTYSSSTASTVKWNKCNPIIETKVGKEKLLDMKRDIKNRFLADKNKISNQNKMIEAEKQILISSKHAMMSINNSSFDEKSVSHIDCSSLKTPIVSQKHNVGQQESQSCDPIPDCDDSDISLITSEQELPAVAKLQNASEKIIKANTLVQQESQNSFISEQQLKEVIKQKNDTEQTGENGVSRLSKNEEQLKNKHSRGTKRKIEDLKALDQDHSIILDLIKEYTESTEMKEFTFQDIADFVRKWAPNLHYFKVVHSVRLFLESNLKTGALKIFGKKYTIQCRMLDASIVPINSAKKAKTYPMHGINLIW